MAITSITIEDASVAEGTWNANIGYDFQGHDPTQPLPQSTIIGLTIYYLLQMGMLDQYSERAMAHFNLSKPFEGNKENNKVTNTRVALLNSLISLQGEIFAINEANGFWEMGVENRSFAQHISLVHSETSEAIEADRKDLPDDKLTEYLGRDVELADTAIRLLDWNGANNIEYVSYEYEYTYSDFSEFAAELHYVISQFYKTKDYKWSFIALDMIVAYVSDNEVPFLEIVLKKLQKNRERGYKHGGKNY